MNKNYQIKNDEKKCYNYNPVEKKALVNYFTSIKNLMSSNRMHACHTRIEHRAVLVSSHANAVKKQSAIYRPNTNLILYVKRLNFSTFSGIFSATLSLLSAKGFLFFKLKGK